MAEITKDERAWVWNVDTPLEGFLAPLEAFWRGLGYQVVRSGHELKGSRELEGQHRSFSAHLSQPKKGTISVRCVIEFSGAMQSVRPGEPTHPAELGELMGHALARGFGPAESAAAL